MSSRPYCWLFPRLLRISLFSSPPHLVRLLLTPRQMLLVNIDMRSDHILPGQFIPLQELHHWQRHDFQNKRTVINQKRQYHPPAYSCLPMHMQAPTCFRQDCQLLLSWPCQRGHWLSHKVGSNTRMCPENGMTCKVVKEKKMRESAYGPQGAQPQYHVWIEQVTACL